ncbi:hypothetical protein AJ80_03621 [Polytolypa hystricis UAMH7299]|uniref:Isochorismatase-like domain-containing protein n=1 Tax=Polytolypa hystricis (strain UAMH7299) TaxID=1447883 RepID=A0A2B7YH51_POLH7|nr:hypothetical protein AJ80_03621 [Polytolypa hystricis UAMH7299]
MVQLKPLAIALALVSPVLGYKFERLDKNNTVLLVVDHQIGLSQLVRDQTPTDFRNNVLAHAAIGKLFDLPTILTTSSETGPNGLLPKEITEMHPDASYIRRTGEVNAWDNKEFRKAVEATGKKQVIIAGIVTEVCTAFLALSLRENGYSVFANTDASGTFNPGLSADANRRMENAGVHLMGMFGIVMDLMRDWRDKPGLDEVLPYLDKYLYDYGLVARAHAGAITNGTLASVQQTLI